MKNGEQPPAHDGNQLLPPPANVAAMPAQDLLQHIKALLTGQDLTSISIGSLRHKLAQRLGLPLRSLDHRRQEIITLTTDAVQQIAAADEQAVLPDWAAPVDDSARLMVYLVTLSAILQDAPVGGTPLRDPSGLSREQVRDAILDAVANPLYDTSNGGRPRRRQAKVDKLVGVKEPHTEREDKEHHHVGLKLSIQMSFLPFKRALRQNHGLASHWSTLHTMFWSVVRYMTFPSEKKPVVDAAPLTWTQDGHALNLYEEAQEPYCAKASKRRREEAAMSAPEKTAKKRKGGGEIREA